MSGDTGALQSIRMKYEHLMARSSNESDQRSKDLAWNALQGVVEDIVALRTKSVETPDDALDNVEKERRKLWYKPNSPVTSKKEEAHHEDGGGMLGLGLGGLGIGRLLGKALSGRMLKTAAMSLLRRSPYGLAALGLWEMASEMGLVDDIGATLEKLDIDTLTMDNLEDRILGLFEEDAAVSAVPQYVDIESARDPVGNVSGVTSIPTLQQPERVAPRQTEFGGDPRYQPLADLIGRKEGGPGQYNALVYKKTPKGNVPGGTANLTSMTFAEVKEFQKKMIGMGHASTAVGRYQMIAPTLASMQEKAGIPDDALFSPQNQDKLFVALADQSGVGRYLNNPTEENRASMVKGLSGTWAAVKDDSGKGTYDGDSVGNKATVDANTVVGAVNNGLLIEASVPDESGTYHGKTIRAVPTESVIVEPMAPQPGEPAVETKPGVWEGKIDRSQPAPRVETVAPSVDYNEPLSDTRNSYSLPINPRSGDPVLQAAIAADMTHYT